ncbi:unnamed protein product [Caenorhabditis auriculariae]|uniref:Uncharacterized protein n=1 Tax=Caenorhabditis auriculariae TaxID=2777116 RepID=A0A8S1GN03_9PELO|nr:unnamed protein product [Caenorhabditis auriculariae]
MPSPTTISLARKQVLPLKPKSSNYVQRLENKPKSSRISSDDVPVTTLELKKKKKVEKNTIVNLLYRKPDHNSNNGEMDCHSPRDKRASSPTSSGYATDTLIDFENHENDDHVFHNSLYAPLRVCEMCFGAAVADAQINGMPIPSLVNGPWTNHESADHFASGDRFAFLTNIMQTENLFY